MTPQEDQPLPAPRGDWALGLQPSATPASAGRASGVPPAPVAYVHVSVLFFAFLFAPMRDCRTVWLSVARQCGAAGLRLVTGFKLVAVCRRVAHCSFPFSCTSILLLTFVSLTQYCLLSELSRRGFVSSSLLDLTLTCTPVFGHD